MFSMSAPLMLMRVSMIPAVDLDTHASAAVIVNPVNLSRKPGFNYRVRPVRHWNGPVLGPGIRHHNGSVLMIPHFPVLCKEICLPVLLQPLLVLLIPRPLMPQEGLEGPWALVAQGDAVPLPLAVIGQPFTPPLSKGFFSGLEKSLIA